MPFLSILALLFKLLLITTNGITSFLFSYLYLYSVLHVALLFQVSNGEAGFLCSLVRPQEKQEFMILFWVSAVILSRDQGHGGWGRGVPKRPMRRRESECLHDPRGDHRSRSDGQVIINMQARAHMCLKIHSWMPGVQEMYYMIEVGYIKTKTLRLDADTVKRYIEL